ncbi:MAG: hypothetical protein U1E76_15970 [Planctomycetota bacterium]
MRVVSLLVIAVTGCAACQSGVGAPPDFVGPFTCDVVLERAFAAYGGRDAYRRLASLQQRARLVLVAERTQAEAAFTLLFKAPDKLRVEVRSSPSLEQVLVFNGRSGRERRSGRVPREDVRPDVERRLKYLFPLLLFDAASGNGARLIGTTTLGDQQAFVLEAREPDRTWTAFLAKDTYLLARLREDLAESSFDTYYADYRSISGRPLAHRFVTLASGRKVQEGTLLDVKVDEPIDDARFEADATN